MLCSLRRQPLCRLHADGAWSRRAVALRGEVAYDMHGLAVLATCVDIRVDGSSHWPTSSSMWTLQTPWYLLTCTCDLTTKEHSWVLTSHKLLLQMIYKSDDNFKSPNLSRTIVQNDKKPPIRPPPSTSTPVLVLVMSTLNKADKYNLG
jgi:hypothetical protein